jgi:hypothetical protein
MSIHRRSRPRLADVPAVKKDDPGVTIEQVKGYLHLDGEPEQMDDTALWVLTLDCWRSLKGTLRSTEVPPDLLLQVVYIRYYQPRAHRRISREGEDYA